MPLTLPRKTPTIPTLRKHDWFPADGFPIAVLRREPQEPSGPHAHDFSELVIIIRAFQAATGASPISYLIKLRLNRAATLLRRAGEDVTAAAFKAGFNDSNYFCPPVPQSLRPVAQRIPQARTPRVTEKTQYALC